MNHAALAAIAAVVLLLGCASTQEVADQGVKSNLAVEEAHNQTLLLNIVRAMKRRPMYFTRFQSLKGPMGIGSPSVTLPVPFGPDFKTQVYNLSFTQTFDKPSFDVQIMDTQKFLQGITKPVAAKSVLYYLDQGWPQQMLLHLFVREIEFVDENGQVTDSLVNYPPNAAEFKKFQDAVEKLHGCDIVGGSVTDKTPIGPVLPLTSLRNLEHLVQSKTAETVLLPVDAGGKEVNKDHVAPVTGYQLAKLEKSSTFKPVQSKRNGAPGCTVPVAPGPGGMQISPLTMGILSEKQVSAEKKGYVRFVIRSPEAMLYYLGEHARAQLELGHAVATLPIGWPRAGSRETLFRVVRGTDDKKTKNAVRTTYDGETYSIPDGAGRSTHVLSLVAQILNLQNEGGEVPATATVRIAQ